MSELILLKKQLAEAEAAYHSLMLGNAIVTTSSPDGSATYNQASRPRLEAYISRLKSNIDASESSTKAVRSPIYFVHPE